MPNKTILLVEDDPNDILLLRRAFAKFNLSGKMQVVENGDDAIAYLSGEKPFQDKGTHPIPCLVLLDLSLPKRSGFEVLQWVRSKPDLGLVPVVVLTSSKDQGDIDRAYKLGANSYLIKTPDSNGTLDVAKIVDAYWVNLNRKPSVCVTEGV